MRNQRRATMDRLQNEPVQVALVDFVAQGLEHELLINGDHLI